MVEIWCAGGVALPRSDATNAGVGCLVRRLLEQDRGAHQSARAVARSRTRGAGPRRAYLCALTGDPFRTAERPLGGQDRKGRDQRPGLDRGDQCLYWRVFQIADAGHRARSHAGAVLANGEAAAQEQKLMTSCAMAGISDLENSPV